jgi:hypothetical protein
MNDLFKPLLDEYSPWTKENPGLNYKKVNGMVIVPGEDFESFDYFCIV